MSLFRLLNLPRKTLLVGTIGACTVTSIFAASTMNEAISLSRRGVDPSQAQPRQRSNSGGPAPTSTLPARLAFVRQRLPLTAQSIANGQYSTLLTHTLTHFTPGHALANMYGLWSFGASFLFFWGPVEFVTMWVGAGAFGGLVGLWWEERKRRNVVGQGIDRPPQSIVGASGSVLGIATAVALLQPKGSMGIMFIVSAFRLAAGNCSSRISGVTFGCSLPRLPSVRFHCSKQRILTLLSSQSRSQTG